ncbi:MAG: cellobiose phosphorylase, partial [Bacilli bacterium]|nr:cellobiose phosphorylase [Bacilli bacterium]
MESIRFFDENGTFALSNPEEVSYLYFPLASETGLKSSITPNLGGDCKLDQETFLLEPVSSENLHTSRSTRNFWCILEDGCWSATGVSAEQEAARFTDGQDKSTLTAGLMWQTVCRETNRYGLRAEITSFVPPQENVEIMAVRITNTGSKPQKITAVAAIPIYGRSADNIRDHRNVTSMLHRIQTTQYGVLVKPTMSFDEKGHRENHRIYYVLGSAGDGSTPDSFYPTVDAFLGEGGTFLHPRSIYEMREGVPSGSEINGRETMGSIRFSTITLEAGQTAEYMILLGVSEDKADIDRVLSAFRTSQQVQAELDATKAYWQEQVNVRYQTGSAEFDRLMRWVSFQPFL